MNDLVRVLAVAFVLVACSSTESGGGTGTAATGVGSVCDPKAAVDPCGSGLKCDSGSDLPLSYGQCTKACAGDGATGCGDDAFCIPGGLCVHKCTPSCPSGTKCNDAKYCERTVIPHCSGVVPACSTLGIDECALVGCSYNVSKSTCSGTPTRPCEGQSPRSNCLRLPGCSWVLE